MHFFYNSQDGDRVYDAESFEYWLKKFFTTGVFEGDLQVTANDNMTITVGSGYANVDGKVRFFEDETTMSLATAGSTYDRIDTVVVERNDSDRDVTVYVITGGYSSDPEPTAPVWADGVYQLVLAQIYVSAGATAITQSSITDTRTDTDLCGIVTGTVEEYDFDQFAAQFDAWSEEKQAEFLEWFEEMKDQLSDDAAGNLQTEIDDITAAIGYVEVEVPSNGWNSSAPYTQSVAVSGMTEDWIPGAPVLVPSGDSDTDLAALEAFACVSIITSGEDTLTFTCYEDLPESDFTIRIPGLYA